LVIGSTVSKIFRSLLVNRINPWYNQQLSQSQTGFRQNYGTTDAILRNKMIQTLGKKTNTEIYALYIDLSAAFDKVVREWVFRSIRLRIPNNSSTKIIDLLQNFYTDTSAYLNDDPSVEIFKTTIGVAQGGIEAPPLFCLFLDFVMRIYENELEKEAITPVTFKHEIPQAACTTSTSRGINGFSHEKWCGYADDTTIYQSSIPNLQKTLEIISKIYKRYGLTLNVNKTKTMIYGIKSKETPKSIIKLNSIKIENVSTFKFLGSLINDR